MGIWEQAPAADFICWITCLSNRSSAFGWLINLKSSFVTANKLVGQFIKLGILNETTGRRRNRRYSYTQYLALFEC